MAARSIGSLTISFGLVAIPVKLYSATQASAGIHFNMLHRKCGSRLRQQYVCIKEDVVVERDEIVKGYEFAKDQYVMFKPEEIKALEEAGTQMVEISEFIPIEAIDPVYYDKAYYLAPDKGGNKPYGLLTEALKESGRCALGRWATRGKLYITLLRPVGDVLVLQQLHYAADVRSVGEMEVPKADVKATEMKLARQLIEQQSSDTFDPTAYTDELRARIQAAIDKKVEAGKEISVSEMRPEAAGGGKVIDLMEALRASLEKTQVAKTATQKLGPKKAPKRAAQSERPARKATRR